MYLLENSMMNDYDVSISHYSSTHRLCLVSSIDDSTSSGSTAAGEAAPTGQVRTTVSALLSPRGA